MEHLCIGIVVIAARCEVDQYLLFALFTAVTVRGNFPDKNFCVLQVAITGHGEFFTALVTLIAWWSSCHGAFFTALATLVA